MTISDVLRTGIAKECSLRGILDMQPMLWPPSQARSRGRPSGGCCRDAALPHLFSSPMPSATCY
ncbi:hypothetical protein IG631_15533 [Alternaria alternata]|nr:hypothetical protein IG631_15533 [Alternaria alternata]